VQRGGEGAARAQRSCHATARKVGEREEKKLFVFENRKTSGDVGEGAKL